MEPVRLAMLWELATTQTSHMEDIISSQVLVYVSHHAMETFTIVPIVVCNALLLVMDARVLALFAPVASMGPLMALARFIFSMERAPPLVLTDISKTLAMFVRPVLLRV